MNTHKKTVRDVEVRGKKVLLRCDFNVPGTCWRTGRRSSPAPTWASPRTAPIPS